MRTAHRADPCVEDGQHAAAPAADWEDQLGAADHRGAEAEISATWEEGGNVSWDILGMRYGMCICIYIYIYM